MTKTNPHWFYVGKTKDGTIVKGTVDTLNYEFQDGSVAEYADTKKSVINTIEEIEDKKSLCLFLCQIIFGIKDKCSTKAENYSRLMAVEHHLTQSELWVDKLFEVYGREGKELYIKTMLLIKEYLMKNSEITATADKCYRK